MEQFHNPDRHLRYLRQPLSQDNEPIGFFISAGCSLSISMPDCQWPLIPDVENFTKFVNSQLEKEGKYELLLSELDKAGKNTDNIENIFNKNEYSGSKDC